MSLLGTGLRRVLQIIIAQAITGQRLSSTGLGQQGLMIAQADKVTRAAPLKVHFGGHSLACETSEISPLLPQHLNNCGHSSASHLCQGPTFDLMR